MGVELTEKVSTNMRSSIVRALSTSAAKANTIPTFGVAGNYAQALHGAANRKGAKEQVSKDIAAFQGALANPKINDFLVSPFVEAKTKLKIVNDVAAELKLSHWWSTCLLCSLRTTDWVTSERSVRSTPESSRPRTVSPQSR